MTSMILKMRERKRKEKREKQRGKVRKKRNVKKERRMIVQKKVREAVRTMVIPIMEENRRKPKEQLNQNQFNKIHLEVYLQLKKSAVFLALLTYKLTIQKKITKILPHTNFSSSMFVLFLLRTIKRFPLEK